jgi:hypothetical protein
MAETVRKALCPSAQPQWNGSIAIGTISGTFEEPRVMPLATALPVTDGLLKLCDPVTPTEVFRFAAPCLGGGCVHFQGSKCLLAQRIVTMLPSVTRELPTCSIRGSCRWWLQEGADACVRCLQIVTDNYNPSEQMRKAAYPVEVK